MPGWKCLKLSASHSKTQPCGDQSSGKSSVLELIHRCTVDEHHEGLKIFIIPGLDGTDVERKELEEQDIPPREPIFLLRGWCGGGLVVEENAMQHASFEPRLVPLFRMSNSISPYPDTCLNHLPFARTRGTIRP